MANIIPLDKARDIKEARLPGDSGIGCVPRQRRQCRPVRDLLVESPAQPRVEALVRAVAEYIRLYASFEPPRQILAPLLDERLVGFQLRVPDVAQEDEGCRTLGQHRHVRLALARLQQALVHAASQYFIPAQAADRAGVDHHAAPCRSRKACR